MPRELQSFDGMIQRHPDLLVLQPLQAEAFVRLVDKAGRAGIPTLIVDDAVASRYAVNINPNTYQAAGASAARLLQLLGGQGNVLMVHAIPGTGQDQQSFAAFAHAMDRCPGVKKAGEAYGNFLSAQAKGDVLRFLATHPGAVDGVLQTAVMAPGIMQAFQETGRPMPIVDDIGPMRGSLGYWQSNRDTYHGVGTGLGDRSLADATVSVALRMLQGQGLKVSDIVNTLPVIDDRTLDQWAQPGWTLSTIGSASGPPDAFADDDYLDPLFRRGAPPAP